MKRELAAFAVFVALALALTWPLALHLDTSVTDRGDPLLVAWILDWGCYALTHQPLRLYDAPIFHPGLYPLAYSENLLGIALVVMPFHLAGLPAIAVSNIALILGLAFGGYGAWVLARLVTRSTPAALLAGIFYAFSSFNVAHIQHVQMIWSGWLPLMLAALLVFWRHGDKRSARLLGGAFVMNGLTNVHWLLFGGFALAVTIAFLAMAVPRRERAFWLRLGTALVVASLILIPFLLPYRAVKKEYGKSRTTSESRAGAATFTAWLAPSLRNATYGPLAAVELHKDERELFPGLLALFLCVYAFTARRRVEDRHSCLSLSPAHVHPRDRQECLSSTRRLDVAILLCAAIAYLTLVEERFTLGRISFSGPDVVLTLLVVLLISKFYPRIRAWSRGSRFTAEELSAALWIAIGFVASLGWNAFLHPFLFRVVEPFRATRTPARWAVIAYVGLAVWAAIGASEIIRKRRWMAAVLLAIALFEMRTDIVWHHLDPKTPPVYAWLKEARPEVILELPMIAEGIPFEYLLAATEHRVRTINGTSGWETPLHEMLRKKELALQFDDAFFETVRANGGEILIVHDARLTPEQRAALAPMLRSLPLVKQFGSDAVYALKTQR